MGVRIALAGNPNSGKTTLFNALTGQNQYVGNWPGVTVEKKHGKFKKHKDAVLVDLPGIYSLSPYTQEEVIARNYLHHERPDAILNIVDGTNLERNLYLTTQLIELGIPVVVAINMSDILGKRGVKLDLDKLGGKLGCKVVAISALKGDGIENAAKTVIAEAEHGKAPQVRRYSPSVEHTLAHIEEFALHSLPQEQQRWCAVKLLERDKQFAEELKLSKADLDHIDGDITHLEEEFDEDAASIITNERYEWIVDILSDVHYNPLKGKLTTSDKIDKVVTNRWLALPIFALVMTLVYWLSISTIGGMATDWTNDCLFGDGWHMFGIGSKEYEAAVEEYTVPGAMKAAFEEAAEAEGLEPDQAKNLKTVAVLHDDETGEVTEEIPVDYAAYEKVKDEEEPDPAAYGNWVPGIPVLVENGLDAVNAADWVKGLVLDGIVGGVGAVLGFVPQMIVLFLLLAFLELCGYMARVAFVMDRIFRKFGLSGKSFIPMLIGTGCSVPGIMASRTIENQRDRRMTVITTSFIPCSAKIPIIGLIAGALFGRAWWVAPSAYFVGISAVVISGIILKKTSPFEGDPAPFVMELPAYHLPTVGGILRSTWERAWSFIRKAGTVILLSAIVLWFLQAYGFGENGFGMVEDVNDSVLAKIGGVIAPVLAPIGFGFWQAAVATITGLIAKENVVGTFGVLYGFDEVAETGWQIWAAMREHFTVVSAYSFLIFNLLCAPCFAAIGAIKREMNSQKWTWFAIGYQTCFAYAVALIFYQIGSAFSGHLNVLGLIVALVLLAGIIYMLVRPDKKKRMAALSAQKI